VVVRHARRGGMLAPLLRDVYLGSPRFLREIAMSRHLAQAGIPTPEVVAGVMYPAGMGHRADVATSRVDGRDLAEIFFGAQQPAGERREAILHAVGGTVRRLHNAGLIHPDLQLRNVLVEDPPRPSPTIFLLDVDTCRAIPKGDDASRRWNLARFARSWEKFNRQSGVRLTEDDRAAFAAGYRAGA
jgi:3-deoxy-D-manno-octulosonic acid kinase